MLQDPIVTSTNHIQCDPFIVIQTYDPVSKIPSYLEEDWNRFAPEYKRYIFDNNEMRKFMVTYFQPIVVEKFDSLEFPHRADL